YSRLCCFCFFFFSSRRRHTRWPRDWSSDVCSSDLFEIADARLTAFRSEADWIIFFELVSWSIREQEFGCDPFAYGTCVSPEGLRSEERRVGKECRSRWSQYHEKKNKKNEIRIYINT